MVRQSRLLPLLIEFLKRPEYKQMETRKVLVWCTVNMLRGGMRELNPTRVENLLEQLDLTMEMPDLSEETLSDTVWSVAYLLDHMDFNQDRITYALNHPRLLPSIIKLLQHKSSRVLSGSLRVIGNIATGTDEQVSVILQMGLLNYLVPLIDANNDQTVRETLWILSNIAAGTEEHISLLLRMPGMVHKLIHMCNDSSAKRRREAQWTIVNCLMGASEEFYFYLLSGGVGYELVRILEEDVDQPLVDRCLQTIHHSLRDRPGRFGHTVAVFKAVGLVAKLHRRVLSRMSQQDIDPFNWQLASSILREYFDVDATREFQPTPTPMSITMRITRWHDG